MSSGGRRGLALAAIVAGLVSIGPWSGRAVLAGQMMSFSQSGYMSSVGGIQIENPYTNHAESAWVGPINATLTDSGGPSLPASFRTYCVDLLRNVYIPSGPLSIGSSLMVGGAYDFEGTGNGVTRMGAARAAYLYATYDPLVDTIAEGIGLQLAIWSAIYNGEVSSAAYDYGLKQGASGSQQFWVSNIGSYGSAYSLARQYLQDSLGQTGNGTFWFSPGNSFPGTIQWQLGGPSGSFQITTTPEPSSLAMAGIGGLALLAFRRFRRAPAA